MTQVQGGLSALPAPVIMLFAAPIAALLIGFGLRKRAPRLTHVPILISCAVVAACAVWLACQVYFFARQMDMPVATWLIAADWGVSFGVRVDGLSASVLAMVGVVGGLIHVYAAGYMAKDEGFSRFFLAFHLFFLAMIGLVMSNNYVQLYLFWELTGLASFLLIGHWYSKPSARAASLQAFMTNRVGDFGLMLAVMIMLAMFHNTRFLLVFPALSNGEPGLVALIGLLLFWAACGKSAQFPLYFWLPDAMEGPTPVSALMHAATMVTAGIFLLARSWPLISSIGDLPPLIAAVGAFTAIFAGVIAATKTDLKRILAYSTVSHLGIMAFALGLGQPAAGVFHLITHGFFKAVLFLCAGSIAHALHQPSAELSQVGGLRKAMPMTFFCFTMAALSLAGVWPFAGFYSKDAVLDAAMHAGGWHAGAGIAIGFLSAYYIFRMLFLTFFGPSPRQQGPGHFHEAEPVLAAPVFFLSLGALGVGWLHAGFSRMLSVGWPGQAGIPELPEMSTHVALIGTAAAAAGAAAAGWLALGWPEWDWRWRERCPRLVRAFEADFGWKAVVGWIARGCWGLAAWVGGAWDKRTLDRGLESSASLARALGGIGHRASTGNVNDYVWWMLAGAAALLFGASRLGVVR